MNEIKRGDDASDHAPKPKSHEPAKGAATSEQDSPNYDPSKDNSQSVPIEDMSSANDE